MTGTRVTVVERPDSHLPAVGFTPELHYTQMLGFAKEMLTTGFLPTAVNTPAKAVAIVMTGREMGIGPMQSLRSISIVQGKPVVAADLQLALFKRAGGRAVFTDLTADLAVLELTHPNGDKHTERFTVEDARAANLLDKDNWKKYRRAMMRSRVITAGLKSVGFEVCAGVYDPDELPPAVEVSATEIPAAADGAPPKTEQPPDGAPVAAVPSQRENGDREPATDKQLAFISRLLQSHVVKPAERKKLEEWLSGGPGKAALTKAIDYWKTQVDQRKKAEKEAGKDVATAQSAKERAVAEAVSAAPAGSTADYPEALEGEDDDLPF